MKLFNENYIKNLPDCYNKEATSNNQKIMQLIRYDEDNFQSVLGELWNSLDLEQAKGYTLDLYGDMVGQDRGKATDEQYLLMIKTKMARNRCGGNYQSIVDCICMILNCQPSDVFLSEDGNSITADKIPLGSIIAADLTPNQFTLIMKSLLPAGVILENSLYAGTFEFASGEGEASQDAGFCQNEGDNYGGYFGVLSDDNADTILPI